jgi:uncharacterized membrane protein
MSRVVRACHGLPPHTPHAISRKEKQMSTLVATVFDDETTAFDMLEGLKQFAGKGRVLQTSLDKDDENTLREVLEKAA